MVPGIIPSCINPNMTIERIPAIKKPLVVVSLTLK